MHRRILPLQECWKYGMTKSREEVFNHFNFDDASEYVYEKAEEQYKSSEITSDILIDILNSCDYTEDQKYVLKEMILEQEEIDAVDCTPPAVDDAIPISWILQWQDEKTDGEFYFDVIIELLEDWEEFKGKKR